MALSLVAGGVAAAAGLLSGGTEPAVSRTAGSDGVGGEQDQAAGSGQDRPQGASHPAGTATPSPSAGCDLNQVTVTASTDKPAYAAGENPMLSMKVTNGGPVACEVNVGTSQMEFLVMSGSDRIFSSKDCQAASEDLVKTIQPGKSETANFPWPRNRSMEGCTAVAGKPGAGTYTFTARLGNKESSRAVFQLAG